MDSLTNACAELRGRGRRVTPQRRAIIQILLADDGSHLTAAQILKRVRRQMPGISPATVYNTLHELVNVDLLLELDLGMGLEKRCYDVNTTDHDHVVCLECGRVVDAACDSSTLTLPSEEEQGFQVVGRRVIYLGYCPDCAPPEES